MGEIKIDEWVPKDLFLHKRELRKHNNELLITKRLVIRKTLDQKNQKGKVRNHGQVKTVILSAME